MKGIVRNTLHAAIRTITLIQMTISKAEKLHKTIHT